MAQKRVKEDAPGRFRVQLNMDSPRQREMVGLALFAFGALVFLSLVRVTPGAISDGIANFFSSLLGWGAFALPVVALGGSALLLHRGEKKRPPIPWGRILAAEILLAALLALAHLASASRNPAALAESGGGGGFVGWTLSQGLASIIGEAGATLLFFLVAVFTLPAVLGMSALGLKRWSEGLAERAASRDEDSGRRTGWRSRAAPAKMVRPVGAGHPVAPPAAAEETAEDKVEEAEIEEEEQEEPAAPRRAPVRPVVSQSATEEPALVLTVRPRRRRAAVLPPVDLLDVASEAKYGETDANRKKGLIEETLANFGIPAKVIEINAGPTVTQFGLEPGFVTRRGGDGQTRQRKVSVGRIAALQHDLELALAASPIRIETPVPGRPIVGIEVPNQSVELVSLRGVLESIEFKKKKGPLKIALGRDVSGAPAMADLAAMPHLLIAGATGSGKSVCINTIIACLLFDNSPDDLRLIMVDPKRVELVPFNNIPHLLGPVVVEMQQVVACLQWVAREMDNRFTEFARVGVRNMQAYNEKVAKSGDPIMPHIVALIDELADLMLAAPEETEKLLTRLAQMARATGIHLVIATQRPSVDVVTGLIKANFPSRISFAVTSSVDSRVVLDTPGAEKLLGRGDMLYMASDSSKLQRLQGCFVSDEEIARLVHFWRERAIEEQREVMQEPPWKALAEAPKKGEDDLIDRAIALVQKEDRTSISILQRKLEIGYPRAARLMDQLEARGIVGPDEGGGKSREVLPQAEDGQESEPENGRRKKKS